MFVYLNNILLVTIVNGRDVEKQGRRVNEGCRYSFVLMVVMLKAEDSDYFQAISERWPFVETEEVELYTYNSE